MVTSVQELLAAANSRSSPLMSLLQGLTQGFGQVVQEAPQRQEIYQKIKMQQAALDEDAAVKSYLAMRQDQATQNAFNGVNPPSSAYPAAKLEMNIARGPNGLLVRAPKMVEAKPDFETVRPEMLANFPTLAKMGYKPGDVVPVTILNQHTHSDLNLGEKSAQFDERQWVKLGQEANLQEASSRKPLGVAVLNNMKAGRGMKLIMDPTRQYTPQDESLITTDLTSIMKGGSPDEELLRQQQYGSYYKSGIQLLQKITGNPQSLNDPDIKAHLRDVIQGIREIDNEAIKNHFDALESQYMDAIKRRPDAWDKLKAKQLKFIGIAKDAMGAAPMDRMGIIEDQKAQLRKKLGL